MTDMKLIKLRLDCISKSTDILGGRKKKIIKVKTLSNLKRKSRFEYPSSKLNCYILKCEKLEVNSLRNP